MTTPKPKAKRQPYDARTLRHAAREARRQLKRCFGDSRPEYRHLDILAMTLLEQARTIERKAPK